MKVGISFLSRTESFYKTIDRINASSADYIHIDVADGLFVNNRTPFDRNMLDYLKSSKKKKDVHLMTLHIKQFVDVFSYLNPEYITYSFEATTKHTSIIKYIKEKKCKVGLAVGPLTELSSILPYLKKIDQVLIMSIIPGYGGQKFIPNILSKIEELVKIRKEQNLHFIINIDGGINIDSLPLLKDVPLDMVVAGSYVCKSINYDERISHLKNLNGK